MAWTTPKTNWATGELVSAEDMNAICENLVALKQPVTAIATSTELIDADLSEFSDVDSTNLNLTITTHGGDVLVHLQASVKVSSREYAYFDIEVDGARQGGDEGVLQCSFYNREGGSSGQSVSLTHIIQNLTAGSHTFKLQMKTVGSVTFHPGAQFWVREI